MANPRPNAPKLLHGAMRGNPGLACRNARRQATSRHVRPLGTPPLNLHGEGVDGSSPSEGFAPCLGLRYARRIPSVLAGARSEGYRHLIDGGINDNLGITTLIETYDAQVRTAEEAGLPNPYPGGAVAPGRQLWAPAA